jgi:tetratricopeptide (TPR) repeat protein
MAPASIGDRVLLYLRTLNDDTLLAARTVAGIGDGIGLDDGALSASVTLLSALDDLVAAGTVERRTADGTDADRATYRLTEDGRATARALAERLRERTVPVADGSEVALGEADRYFDERPLVTALARLGEDGQLYPEADGQVDAFVGRETELDALLSATDRDDGVGLVRVVGRPGVGKTELLDEFADAAGERGTTVTRATCEAGTGEPYAPVLAALGDEATVERLRGGGAADDPEAASAWRAAAFDEAATELERLAGGEGVVLALDDCHRVDDGTLALLSSLAERRVAAPVTVVLAHRPPAEDADRSLSEWWTDLPGDDRETVTLDPFDEPTTGELIRSLVGRGDVPERFVAAVHGHTGGTPLFVEETVDRLIATGRVDPLTGTYPEGDLGVPDGARAVVEHRLAGLSGTAEAVLAVGAALGVVVHLGVLVETVDAPRTAVLDAVDALVRSDVWDRVDDATVRFRSEVVREVAHDRLDADRRERLHRRIATTLSDGQAAGGDESARRVAHHFAAGGADERAGEQSLRAARGARDVAAHRDAIEAYEAAIDHLPETDEWEAERREALEGIGYCHYVLGEFDEADRYFEYVRERASDTEELQRLYERQAQLAEQRGRSERVAELVDAGLALDDESETACELLSLRGWGRFRAGEYERASEVFERERTLAEALGSDELVGNALHDLGTVAIFTGRLEDAERLLPQALDLRPDDATVGRANTLNNLGILARRTGRVDEAADYYERALALRREAGMVHAVAESLANLGVVDSQRGELTTAIDRSQEALERYRAVDDRLGVAQALGNLGRFERYRGDLSTAEDHLAESASLYRDLGNATYEAMARTRLGTVRRDAGDLEAATETLGIALELATDAGDGSAVATARSEFARTLAADGGFDRAEDLLAELADHIDEVATPEARYHLALGRGVLARERGDHAGALDQLERAVELAETMNDDRQVVEAEFERALTLLARDGDAERTLAELRVESERQGMDLYVRRCQSALERSGST